MKDAMLTELYKRAFETKQQAESLGQCDTDTSDRARQVAIAKNEMLSELIDIRTDQIKYGQ